MRNKEAPTVNLLKVSLLICILSPVIGKAEEDVWQGLTLEEVDQSLVTDACNRAEVIQRWRLASQNITSRIGEPERFSYGSGTNEKLNLFSTDRQGAPIMVFIHGGGWRSTTARDYAFPAPTFTDNGVHYVVLDFDSVSDVDGDIQVLVDQTRRAMAWIYHNAEEFEGDNERIYVSGHSSGAHLATLLVTSDWTKSFSVPSDMIKGVLAISGIFDLEALRLSSSYQHLELTPTTVNELSPQRRISAAEAPLIVAYGTLENLALHGKIFYHAAQEAGKSVQLIEAEQYHHFDVLETMGNPYGILGVSALRMTGAH